MELPADVRGRRRRAAGPDPDPDHRRHSSRPLLDACLAFYPEVFAGCASLALVRQAVGEVEHLDLSERLPVGWQALRAEGKEVMEGAALRMANVAVG